MIWLYCTDFCISIRCICTTLYYIVSALLYTSYLSRSCILQRISFPYSLAILSFPWFLLLISTLIGNEKVNVNPLISSFELLRVLMIFGCSFFICGAIPGHRSDRLKKSWHCRDILSLNKLK